MEICTIIVNSVYMYVFSVSSLNGYFIKINGFTMRVSFFSGTAGDSFDFHRGSAFSTKDRDNDVNSRQHCAVDWKGGWWYSRCQHSNLNGLYLKGSSSLSGVRWYHWRKDNESLKISEMKIRPNDF